MAEARFREAAFYNYHSPTPVSCLGGQLASVSYNSNSTTYVNYDCLGRVTASLQNVSGAAQTYGIGYAYNLNDSLQSITYPSNKVVTYSYDVSNHLKT